MLCMLVCQRPNVLLMDEPTNHLDLATREALAVALNEFEGTVMLVSHDRSLLRSVCDEFWLVSRGGIEPFEGDLDDYQRYLLDEAKRAREVLKDASRASAAEAAPVVQAPPPVVAPVKKAPVNLKALKNELGKLEQRILELQTKKHALTAKLATALPPKEIGEVGSELQKVDEELDAQELRWLEVSEQIEAAG